MESVTTPPYLLAQADALRIPLADRSVHCCVTSPPYFSLRDYGVPGQIGMEKSPAEYVARLVVVMREVGRVLRDDGTLWLNLGDSFADVGRNHERRRKDASGVVRPSETKTCERCGKEFSGGLARRFCSSFCGGLDNSPRANRPDRIKAKDLLGLPWRVAFALQADGWYLRMDNIWFKPNPMPESVRDRPSKAHEYVFLFSKAPRYYYDVDGARVPHAESSVARARRGWNPSTRNGDNRPPSESERWRVKELAYSPGGSNMRSVWKVSTVSYKGAHFATFPPKLVEPCVKAGTSERGCCPVCGAPWVRQVERERVPTRPGLDSKCLAHSDGCADSAESLGWNRPNVIGNRDPARHVTAVRTLGWQPSCRCEPVLDPSPCRVLDPFAGSGTAVAVARNLGRLGIGLDLSRAYLGLASERVEAEWLKAEESRLKAERPHRPRPRKRRALIHTFLPGFDP